MSFGPGFGAFDAPPPVDGDFRAPPPEPCDYYDGPLPGDGEFGVPWRLAYCERCEHHAKHHADGRHKEPTP